MIKTLDVFVDVSVSTIGLRMRARDDVGVGGFRNGVVVVLKGNMTNGLSKFFFTVWDKKWADRTLCRH